MIRDVPRMPIHRYRALEKVGVMDLVTAAVVLGRILVAGLTARLGVRNEGLDADDVSALEKFLELGTGAAGALRGLGGPGSASMEALHFGLVTQAFGAALRDH
jgi:hypothetical protein